MVDTLQTVCMLISSVDGHTYGSAHGRGDEKMTDRSRLKPLFLPSCRNTAHADEIDDTINERGCNSAIQIVCMTFECIEFIGGVYSSSFIRDI